MILFTTYYEIVFNFASFNNLAFLFVSIRVAASVALILFTFIASNIDDGIDGLHLCSTIESTLE